MLRTAHTLSTLGLPLNDKLITIAIVISLPPSYDTLKTILTAAKSSEMTVENMHSQVALKEHQRTCEVDASGTFAARFKGGQKGNQKHLPQAEYLEKLKAKGHCMHCRKHSHKTKDCCKLKAECKKNPTTACIASDSIPLCAQTHSDNNDLICLFKMADKLTKRGDLINCWLINSGASRTMSLHRDWFQAYRQLKRPRKVWLRDNTFILAHGVGRIPVHMHANQKWNRVVLQDVLHIPELHGNLLSVSALAQRGA